MVRSFWIGPSVIALALTATAWGQPAAPAPAKPGERVIKVQEDGKSPQRCRVLQAVQQPGGGKAYQVQALETGEMLTIVASASPSAPGQPARPTPMTIIHWGKPPAGSPMPSVAGTAQSPAPPRAGMPRPMPTSVAVAPTSPVVPTRRPPPTATPVMQSSLPPAPPSAYAPVSSPDPMRRDAPVVPNRRSSSLPVAQKMVPAETQRTAPDPLARVPRPLSPVREAPAASPTAPAMTPVTTSPRTAPSLPVAERVEPADTRVNMPPAEAPRTVTDVPRWPLLSRLRERRSAPRERFATERALPVGEGPMPADPRATLPAPVPPSVTPVQATSTDAHHAQPAKGPESASPHDGHALPVVEKMTPADTRVTLPPAESTPHSGSTMWPPAHCDQTPGPLGEMHSRKEAVREQQKQAPQPKYGLTDRIAEHCDKGPRVVYPEAPPVVRPTLIERIFGRRGTRDSGSCAVCEPQVCEEPVPLPVPAEQLKTHPKTMEEKKTMLKADVEPAKPVDNRQSWGKYEPLDPVLPNRTGRVVTSTKPESKPMPKPPAPMPPGPKADDASWLKPSASKPAKTVEDPELPHARKTTDRDPLTSPGAFTPLPPEAPSGDPVRTPDLPARKVPPSPSLLPPPPPVSGPGDGGAGRTGRAPRPGTSNVPGSGSVFAAGEPHYVPVPMVTMPAPPRPALPPPSPPSPPIPQPPQAPALNRMVNSGSGVGQAPPGMANAFTEPGPTRPIPSETTPSDLEGNAFSGPAPAASAMPAPPNPALAGGYPPAPQGYAPGMSPMPPQGMAVQRYPVQPPNFTPAAYSNYQMPGPGGMALPPAGYAQPAPAASPMPSVAQLLQMLRESDFPSQREWAAEQLSATRSNPEAVQGLVTAAKTDPAPMVRVCCVRSLMKMQANTVPVVTAVQELKNDADPRVRDAVGEALAAFGVAPAVPGTTPIQPVGGH